MDFNAYAGQRVLYKINGHNWKVGTLVDAGLEEEGLYFCIHDLEDDNYDISTSINNIFFNARKLDDWEKESYLFEKQEFLNYVAENDLHPQTQPAYISDGEYIYYLVAKFNANWLNKQPFKYVYCEV